MHAISLTNLFQLACHSQPNWISAFTVFTHTSKSQEVVLGISTAGVATVWTLNGEEKQHETKYEHESKVINCPVKVIALYCCPRTPRLVLLITSAGWKILDAMGCNILESHPNPPNDSLLNGEFLSPNTVLVYGKSGQGYLYQIVDRVKDSNPVVTDSGSLLLAKICFDQIRGEKSSPCDNNLPSLCLFSLLPPSNRDMPTDVRIVGTNSHLPGTLLVWSFPISLLKPGAQIINPEPVIKQPIAVQSLEQVWKANHLTGLRRCILSSTGDKPTVSVLVHSSTRLGGEEIHATKGSENHPQDSFTSNSVHAAVPPRLVIGTESGDIVVCRMTEALEHLFWHPTNEKSAAITALCHPMSVQWERSLLNAQGRTLSDLDLNGCDYSGNNRLIAAYRFDPGLLLSASDDCTVRLWELNMGLDEAREKRAQPCLRVFSSFVAPVISFVIGPPISSTLSPSAGNPNLSCCVSCVTADGSVSLVNLKERSSLLKCVPKNNCSVVAIGWRAAEAFLYIYRQDGTLSIWEATSGILERVESGQLAIDLFDECESKTQLHQFKSGASTGVSFGAPEYPWTNGGDNSPLLSFVSSSESSACVGPPSFTARAQLTRKRCLRVCPGVRQTLSPVGLFQFLSCSTNRHSPRSIHCHEQPGLRVFLWDIESLLGTIVFFSNLLLVDILIEAGMLENLRENVSKHH
ncbi:hypothetical protein Ciccas_010424 [Cichlidogyrus casuarinus]|uniref:Uncharacterized protein n=1 Tax=Cichlidogyrus casuarinus TaxID=1844966 RepID=A0ABD2PU85_9PLAT